MGLPCQKIKQFLIVSLFVGFVFAPVRAEARIKLLLRRCVALLSFYQISVYDDAEVRVQLRRDIYALFARLKNREAALLKPPAAHAIIQPLLKRMVAMGNWNERRFLHSLLMDFATVLPVEVRQLVQDCVHEIAWALNQLNARLEEETAAKVSVDSGLLRMLPDYRQDEFRARFRQFFHAFRWEDIEFIHGKLLVTNPIPSLAIRSTLLDCLKEIAGSSEAPTPLETRAADFLNRLVLQTGN